MGASSWGADQNASRVATSSPKARYATRHICLDLAPRRSVFTIRQARAARSGQPGVVPVTAFATIYRRGESFFITSSDQTTVGLWVHSGSVERVDRIDAEAIGSALMRQLDRSTLGVPHPRRTGQVTRGREGAPATRLAGRQTAPSRGRQAAVKDDIPARAGAPRRRDDRDARQRRAGRPFGTAHVSASSGTRRAGAKYRNHAHTPSAPSVNRPSTPNIDQIVAEEET